MENNKNENPKTVYKTLKIKISTYKRLKPFGQFDDTLDELINRLIDKVEESQ